MDIETDVTIRELAVITCRHIETLRRLARATRLPGAYRIGQRWMIRRDAVDALRGLARSERRSS